MSTTGDYGQGLERYYLEMERDELCDKLKAVTAERDELRVWERDIQAALVTVQKAHMHGISGDPQKTLDAWMVRQANLRVDNDKLRAELKTAELVSDRLRLSWREDTAELQTKLKAVTAERDYTSERWKSALDAGTRTLARLDAARKRVAAMNTCVVCSASLMPNAVPPHCIDTCVPTEEQEDAWAQHLAETDPTPDPGTNTTADAITPKAKPTAPSADVLRALSTWMKDVGHRARAYPPNRVIDYIESLAQEEDDG